MNPSLIFLLEIVSFKYWSTDFRTCRIYKVFYFFVASFYSEPEDVHFNDDENHVYALIINGHSLVHALHTELERKFVDLCTKCE